MKVYDLPTPSLLVDVHAFDRNVATMAKRWPGDKLRPHVKAFKSTALAARLAESRPSRLLLRHRARDDGDGGGRARRRPAAGQRVRSTSGGSRAVIESGRARITVAVDSEETIAAAAKARVPEVLHRRQRRHAPLRLRARGRRAARRPGPRRRASAVRGVMGYEGHLMREPGDTKADLVERSMGVLLEAADGGRRRRRVRRRHRHLGRQHLGHRAPGRQLLPDGHRVHAARVRLRERAVRAGHGHLEERPVGRARRRAQGVRHGPRRPEGRSTWATAGSCRDEHITFGLAEGGDGRASATGCA